MKDIEKELGLLTERYLAFCDKHDLDPTLEPEQQLLESDNLQRWLDSHIMKTNKLITEKINMTSRAKAGNTFQSPSISAEPDFEDNIYPDWSVLENENPSESVHFH